MTPRLSEGATRAEPLRFYPGPRGPSRSAFTRGHVGRAAPLLRGATWAEPLRLGCSYTRLSRWN
jgi:hypothetical protein